MKRSLGSAAIWVFGGAVAVALTIANAIIGTVGLSTMPSDAPNTVKGLIQLLRVIASWDWRVLVVLAAIALSAQFYAVFSMQQYIDEARVRLGALKPFEKKLEELAGVSAESVANAKSASENAIRQMAERDKQMSRMYLFSLYRIRAAEIEIELESPLKWREVYVWKGIHDQWIKAFESAMNAAEGIFQPNYEPHPGASGRSVQNQETPKLLEAGMPDELVSAYHNYKQMKGQFNYAVNLYEDRVKQLANL